MSIHRWLRAVENVRGLDRPAAVVSAVVRRMLKRVRMDGALRGSWLGHPLHPLMVTLPIGAWMAAAMFDAVGNNDAARKLVGFGLAAAPPTILLGLADYADLGERQRRVGLVHAATNTAAVTCFATSYWLRRDGLRGGGKLWTLLGLVTLSVGGAFGGHLSYAQGAGVYRWQARATEPLAEPQVEASSLS